MASFYAELQVAGRTYPVRSCTYEFSQATGERGRVAAKVRHGLVRLTLDVPEDDVLLDWAATPHKPLAGRVIFRSAQGGAALETLSWEAGQCVGYQEAFASGDIDAGAYVCHLTIAAPQLRMQPGGPAAYVSPAPGEHGSPQQSLVNPFVVPLLTPVAPVLEAVAGAAAATVLAPLALTLALILASSTPAGGPGLPTVNRDEARLRYLVAQHAAGNLVPGEEAELIALLAKVKGIHVQKLSDLKDLYQVHTFNGHRIDLSSCPVAIPSSATIIEQSKTGYDQVKFKWDDDTHGYEARWHTRTPGAPITQGNTWVVTRTTPGTAQGQRKAQHILTGPSQWTPSNQWQSAVSANQSGTATAAQKLLLNSGHWAANK